MTQIYLYYLVEVAIATLAVVLIALLVGLVLWRGIDELRFQRRQQLIRRYRPLIDALHLADAAEDIVPRLVQTPQRHRHVLADLLLSGLRVTRGDIVPRLHEAAAALGLIAQWTAWLQDRRWWKRTEAARALGLVRHGASMDGLLIALEDPHEEVRAAAVDAIGRLGDPRCGPALLARLRDESRHQRARLIEALRALGSAVVPTLLAHARHHATDTTMVLDILAVVGGTEAIESLLEWTANSDAAVRAAALRVIGSIGLDDRSFFYALRGLDDTDVNVRAMAARALGRSGRQAAVPYLSPRLDDEWLVAAHCATGLRRLGHYGTAALQERAGRTGQGAELARQILWELTHLKVGA